jgi:hypothetical protein
MCLPRHDERMKPVTRVYALPKGLDPRAKPELLHEWPQHIPEVGEGAVLQVGSVSYRVRYRGVVINEDRGEVVVFYTVQDAREEPRT